MNTIRSTYRFLRTLALGPVVAALAAASADAQTPPGFTDVTAECGMGFIFDPADDSPEVNTHGGGTEGDFDGDGWPDLFIAGGGKTTDRLFINNHDGTFTDMAASAGLTLLYRGDGATAADYDSDGDMDIYVSSGGDMSAAPQNGQHKLWRNNGDLTFTDVAVEAGVNSTGTVVDSSGSAFGDYDLDGDLDLCACGFYFSFNPFGFASQVKLFRNNLSETRVANFTNVTAAAGIAVTILKGYSPIFVDIDGDLHPELLVAGDFDTTRYFRNNTDGTFTDVPLPLVAGDGKVVSGMGSCIGDFDRDARMDWYVTGIYPAWHAVGASGNFLYMNIGGGLMQSLPESAGVTDGGWGWGAATIDFDNDGWQDIVETNGWGNCDSVTLECFVNEPSYLFRNNGDNTFSEVHAENGLVNTDLGRGLITLDYDRDGDMDIVILSIESPSSPGSGDLQLNRNNICSPAGVTPGANFLEVHLDTSERADLAPNGFGANVRVTTGSTVQHVRITGGCNYLGRSQLVAHFGLADAILVDDLTVTWPNGETKTLTNVEANQILTVSADPPPPPPPPVWFDLGLGKAGSNGVPLLAGTGPLTADSLNQLDLTSGPSSSTATLIFGLSAIDAPFKGGVLVPSPLLLLGLPTTPDGAMSLPFLFPAGIPPGFPLYFQFWNSDAGATFNLSASNGLQGITN